MKALLEYMLLLALFVTGLGGYLLTLAMLGVAAGVPRWAAVVFLVVGVLVCIGWCSRLALWIATRNLPEGWDKGAGGDA